MIVEHTGPASKRLCLIALLLAGAAPVALAQVPESADGSSELVSYEASFFERYQPNTALDMVNQLPGFVLEDGGDSRGFASAAGNILINENLPSAIGNELGGLAHHAGFGGLLGVAGQADGLDGFMLFQSTQKTRYCPWAP